MENETHVCDDCKQPVVIGKNGGAINNPAGGPPIAYVHDHCKEKWEKEHSASTYQKVKK